MNGYFLVEKLVLNFSIISFMYSKVYNFQMTTVSISTSFICYIEIKYG